jgi:lipopolysaccharide export system permease protein
MQIVERYILHRTTTAFLVTLFWTLAAVWTSQVVARINLVTDSGQSLGAFMHLATLMLPSMLPIVMPFSVAIAVAHTLTTMNTDSELVVINAAGSPRYTVARPVLIMAGAASVVAFFVVSFVDPIARQEVRDLVASARADLISTIIQEGSFSKLEDGLFVHVGERLPDGRLGSIFVSDSRDPTVDLMYYAKDGAVAEGLGKSVLVMSDGIVHRKSPAGDISVIRYNSYAFDLSAFSSDGDKPKLYPKDHTLAYLLNPDPNDRYVQERPQRLRAEIHHRLTDWTFPFVFALIALAVAGDARSHREARLHPMVTALVAALFVRWLGFFAVNEAEDSAAFTPAVYAVPVLASAVSVCFILTNRSMELPESWTEKLVAFYRALSERAAEWWFALRSLRWAALRRRA